jgi:uncharacterized protein YbcI
MPHGGDHEDASSPQLAISNALVRLLAEHTGRGPTQARTVISGELITVVLRDLLTKAERRLVEADHGEIVRDMRHRVHRVIRPDAIAAVERITGRRVLAYFEDHEIDHDVALQAFLLESNASSR